MSSLIAPICWNVVSVGRTILSILLVEIVVCKEVSNAWLIKRLDRRIIESSPVISVHCCVTIEIVSLISAVHVRYVLLLQPLHFDVIVPSDASVDADVAAYLLNL